MTDETKATAMENAESTPAVADPEQVKAEAERAAREVAERKARSLDFMENYRDNQKAEKEERARRAASTNRAKAKAEEEKRLKEEAERAAREEARRKEKEEFEARAKRNAAMLTEIGEEEARQKEEEAAEARLAAAQSPVKNAVPAAEKPAVAFGQNAPVAQRPAVAFGQNAPIAQRPAATPVRPAAQKEATAAFTLPPVTDFFAGSEADSDDLLSEITVDGMPLGEKATDGVIVLGTQNTADESDDLASLIQIHTELPEGEDREPSVEEKAAEPVEETPAADAAKAPAYQTPDDYIKAWEAAYGTDSASYDDMMKKWWENYGAMYTATPAYGTPGAKTPTAGQTANAQAGGNNAFFFPAAQVSSQKAYDDAENTVGEETEKAVEEAVKKSEAEVLQEEKAIAAAPAVDPLSAFLKEQSEKIAERRGVRAKTKLPDKLDVQAEICNLYFDALAEIYRQNGKKFRKLYRDGARREIDIYNDMLRKYLKKKSGAIAFVPVDPTIPNRILKGEAPELLYVKPLQKESAEDAAKRKEKIFSDIEKMEGAMSPDEFAKWLAEQETAFREKKAALKAAKKLPDKIAAEEAACRILFGVLHEIAAQDKKTYAASYREKARKEISVYNDLVRKAGNPKKTGLVSLAYNIPDRLLKGEVFDPFAKETLQKDGKSAKKETQAEDAFTKYLAEKNAKIRDAKASFELADAEERIHLEAEVCSHYFDILEQIYIHKKKAYAATYKNRTLTEIALYNSLTRKAGKWFTGDRTPIAKIVPDRILRGELLNPFRRRGANAADEALALLADAATTPEEKRHNDEAYLKAKENYELSRRKKCYYTAGLSFLFLARKDKKKARKRMKREIRAMEKRVKPVEEVEAYHNARYLDLLADKKRARRRADPIFLRKLRDRITDLLDERDRVNRRLIELYEYDAWKPAALGKKALHTYLGEKHTAFKKMKKTADRVGRMRLDPEEKNELYRLMDRVTELQAELRTDRQLRAKSKKPADRMQAQIRTATLTSELSLAEERLASKLNDAEHTRRNKRRDTGAATVANVFVILAALAVIGSAAYLLLRSLGIL